MLAQSIATLFQICLLRKGPQDIPYSYSVLIQLITLYAIFVVWVAIQIMPLPLAILIFLADIGIPAGFLYCVLKYCQLRQRWMQLYTTFIGIAFLFDALGVLFQAFIGPFYWVLLIVIIWKLFVYKHLFEQTLGLNSWPAFGLVCFYGILYGSMMLGLGALCGIKPPLG